MDVLSERVAEVFLRAADLVGDDRRQYLDQACGDQPEVRAGVERLLANDLGGFLEAPVIRVGHAGSTAFSGVDLGFGVRGADEGVSSAPGSDITSSAVMGSCGPTYESRYEHKGEVGRGGMGAVYRVRDKRLGRDVAMKVSLDTSPKATRRFLGEACIASRLVHPGVASVHDLGADGSGGAFFTMPLLEGETLEQILKGRAESRWTTSRLLEVLIKVGDAMSYAHSEGVIHRDLKPANIMVGKFGEVQVMDWGLAKLLRGSCASQEGSHGPSLRNSDEVLHTEPGGVMGTLPYMAPEQASGDPASSGVLVDVYSLGAIIYHVLAWHAPYDDKASSWSELLDEVRDGPPKAISSSLPTCVRGREELVSICEKAMAREVGSRYRSMLALVDDLRRFLEGRVVSAYSGGAIVAVLGCLTRSTKSALALACIPLLFLVLVLFVQLSKALEEDSAKEQMHALVLARIRDYEDPNLLLSLVRLNLSLLSASPDLQLSLHRSIEARLADLGNTCEAERISRLAILCSRGAGSYARVPPSLDPFDTAREDPRLPRFYCEEGAACGHYEQRMIVLLLLRHQNHPSFPMLVSMWLKRVGGIWNVLNAEAAFKHW